MRLQDGHHINNIIMHTLISPGWKLLTDSLQVVHILSSPSTPLFNWHEKVVDFVLEVDDWGKP